MFKYVILGVVQGLTEFLPVSSSGHLVLMQRILGLKGEEVALSLVLHLGTLAAVILFFLKDIKAAFKNKNTIYFILVATFITGVIGFLGKDFFEGLFSSPKLVMFSLTITGIILILTRYVPGKGREEVTVKDSIILGLSQALAIVPGISRSGVTISTLLFRKIDREISFRLSFLVSIPLIIGAFVLEIRSVNEAFGQNIPGYLAGFISSLVSGLLALILLKFVIRKARFHLFGYYCILIAVITFLFIR